MTLGGGAAPGLTRPHIAITLPREGNLFTIPNMEETNFMSCGRERECVCVCVRSSFPLFLVFSFEVPWYRILAPISALSPPSSRYHSFCSSRVLSRRCILQPVRQLPCSR